MFLSTTVRLCTIYYPLRRELVEEFFSPTVRLYTHSIGNLLINKALGYKTNDFYIIVTGESGEQMAQKNHLYNYKWLIFSDSDRIQTCNLLIRSQMLYSVEPRSRFVSANIRIFHDMQIFTVKFAPCY